MTIAVLLVFLVFGAFAGWLAGLAAQGHGVGTAVNLGVGAAGGLIGGWAFEAAQTAPLLAFGAVLFAVFVGALALFTALHHVRVLRTRHARADDPPRLK